MPAFTTESATARPPAETFDFMCDLARWPLFRGHGPFPGIAEARLVAGASLQPGARIRVTNTDGSVHHEVVLEFEPAQRYRMRMEFGPPASFLIGRAEEEAVFHVLPGGTRVLRRFTLTPRSPLTWPLVALAARGLRKAVERHDAEVAGALA